MKKMLLSTFLVLGVTLLIGPTPARAQYDDDAVVKIPFRFIVDDTVMPAGTYEVLVDGTNPSLVKIYQKDGPAAALVTTQVGGSDYEKAHPRFNFRKYGTTYFLTEVLLPGDAPREVPLFSSDVEHELAKLAAMRSQTRQTHKG